MSSSLFTDIYCIRPEIVCTICLVPLQGRAIGHTETNFANERISHVIHFGCLMEWIAACANKGEESSCPLCRQIILPKRSISEHIDFTPSEILEGLLQRVPISDLEREQFVFIAIEKGKTQAVKSLQKHQPLSERARESLIPFAARKGSQEIMDALYEGKKHSEGKVEILTRQAVLTALDEL